MIKVTQDKDQPLPTEVMAQAVVDISVAMNKLMTTRLKRDTIVTLIQHDTKLTRRDIEKVICSLEDLQTTYLKPLVANKAAK